MDAYESILDDLKHRTNGKSVITPEQLSHVLPISTKQQSKLRQDKEFPIPHKNIGRNVFYSIYHVADFLLSGEIQHEEPEQSKQIEQKVKKPRVPKTSTSSAVDYSHLFLLRSFASNVQAEIHRLQVLHDFLTQIDKSTSLRNELQAKLSNKT
ncbi:hypothetical protein [Burkholderia cenocepacia]|uniref:hypothetical protein n=1 Tax=Burkholderia cenocepacia TaxID=95486 RepID=UPI00264B218A|nr:hypothetical protein [Burkholderia cenocepacia]MDN7680535.1 hypothetical protein [Burkholderia cenocepacia]